MIVMLIEPDCCNTKPEWHKCKKCGLGSSELWAIRQELPATDAFLKEAFPEWTGYGAILQ